MATTVRLLLLCQDSRNDSMVSLFTLEHGNRIDNQLMQLMPLLSVIRTTLRWAVGPAPALMLLAC